MPFTWSCNPQGLPKLHSHLCAGELLLTFSALPVPEGHRRFESLWHFLPPRWMRLPFKSVVPVLSDFLPRMRRQEQPFDKSGGHPNGRMPLVSRHEPKSSRWPVHSLSLWHKSPQVETMDHDLWESTYPKETHLKNIRQLTFGGDNAEAYWAFGGNALVYQTTQPQAGIPCDQIFVMPLDSMGTPDADMRPHRASTGLGRTTCPYFLPGDSVVVYATTEGSDSACPEVPERGPEGRYVWPIYPTYDMVLHNLHTQAKTSIATSPHYDAEATVSPKGDRMVFTSTRNGDLDLYTCDLDGNDIQQVTNTLGYDGGAFFSPDGKWLVWRASRPKTEEEIQKYKALLSQKSR